MIKRLTSFIFLMVFICQLHASEDDIVFNLFSCVTYHQKGDRTYGEIFLEDGTSWMCEVPFLNDYGLDNWKEGDFLSIFPKIEKSQSGKNNSYQDKSGFVLSNVGAHSEVLVFPTKNTLSRAIKIVDIRIDTSSHGTAYYIQLEDGFWRKSDILSARWDRGQRVWVDRFCYNGTYQIINLDITPRAGYIERSIFGAPVDGCPITACPCE